MKIHLEDEAGVGNASATFPFTDSKRIYKASKSVVAFLGGARWLQEEAEGNKTCRGKERGSHEVVSGTASAPHSLGRHNLFCKTVPIKCFAHEL